jgi:uncharacterized protein
MDSATANLRITYLSQDITDDIQPLLLSFSYRDNFEGEADQLSLTLRNDDGRFLIAKTPKKGDKISGAIQTADTLLPCGTFTVDEISYTGSRSTGHTVTLNAVSTPITKALRTKTSAAHEGKTLRHLADAIAQQHGFTVAGITRDFPINRITRFHETDLGFLARISQDFGYLFSLKDSTLVFTTFQGLNKRDPVATLERSKCLNYSVREKASDTFSEGSNRYHDSKLKKTFEDLRDAGANPSADAFRTTARVDSGTSSIDKVTNRLHRANLKQVEITATIPGNVRYRSGNNVLISGFGRYDGKYMVITAEHAIDRSRNYITDVTLNKIPPPKPITSPPVEGSDPSETTAWGSQTDTAYKPYATIIYTALRTLTATSASTTLLATQDALIRQNIAQMRAIAPDERIDNLDDSYTAYHLRYTLVLTMPGVPGNDKPTADTLATETMAFIVSNFNITP